MCTRADIEKKIPTEFCDQSLNQTLYDRASSSNAIDDAQVYSVHRPQYVQFASCLEPGFAHVPQEEEEGKEDITYTASKAIARNRVCEAQVPYTSMDTLITNIMPDNFCIDDDAWNDSDSDDTPLSNIEQTRLKRRRINEGLQVPVRAPKAEQIMSAQGWKKGEPLGKADYGRTRILTPLSPFTQNTHYYGDTRGLH